MAESTVEVPVALNSDVALECAVLDAKPPPRIKWYDDQGEIHEVTQHNSVRFLDGGHHLYLRKLEHTHLHRQYYCAVTNVNLSQEVSAPTRFVLIDNLTLNTLIDYKQIGNLTAYVGNMSIEFAYVGGAFGENINGTANMLLANDVEVTVLGNIGSIDLTSLRNSRTVLLQANVRYGGFTTTRWGTLIIHRKLIYFTIIRLPL